MSFEGLESRNLLSAATWGPQSFDRIHADEMSSGSYLRGVEPASMVVVGMQPASVLRDCLPNAPARASAAATAPAHIEAAQKSDAAQKAPGVGPKTDFEKTIEVDTVV